MKELALVLAAMITLVGCMQTENKHKLEASQVTNHESLADLCWLAPSEEVTINFTYDDQGMAGISVALLSQDELFFKVEGASEQTSQVLMGVLIADENLQKTEALDHLCGVIKSVGDEKVTLRVAENHLPFMDQTTLDLEAQRIAAAEPITEQELPVLWGWLRNAQAGTASREAELEKRDWFVSGESLIHDAKDYAIIHTSDIPKKALDGLRNGSASLIIWGSDSPYLKVLGAPSKTVAQK